MPYYYYYFGPRSIYCQSRQCNYVYACVLLIFFLVSLWVACVYYLGAEFGAIPAILSLCHSLARPI